MHVMDALGDPVRRRIVELLADGGRPAGALAAAVGAEFGISQPATSRHLRVLREARVLDVEARGAVRLYSVRPGPLAEVEEWAHRVRQFWTPRLDALETEVARGRRADRTDSGAPDDRGGARTGEGQR